MFRIKSWHFLIVFFILLISINLIDDSDNINSEEYYSDIKELEPTIFNNEIATGINCVLFYTDDSFQCKKVEYLMTLLDREGIYDINFYKLNIEKYPGNYGNYDISGIPTVVIYQNGSEIKRIMGNVGISNWQMILERITKPIRIMNNQNIHL